MQLEASTTDPLDDKTIEDDQLRLIFTCCHPALMPDAQVAMTLARGLRADHRGDRRAFLSRRRPSRSASCRAKAKIRDAETPYETPDAQRAAGPARICAAAPSISSSTRAIPPRRAIASSRHDLCGEAIRLGRLLVALLPDPEAIGLLALMLLQESRRAARATPSGEVVLLEDQDRGRWNRALIVEGQGAGRARASHGRGRLLHDPGGDRRRARAAPRAWRAPTGRASLRSTTSCSPPIRRRSSS